MSEEEKELIKELERKSNLVATNCEIFIERYELFTILNLIDKLQKENEKLKQDNYNLDRENQLMFEKIIEENNELKDKIREIVEKSYNDIDYFNRDIRKDLEDLLEE